MMTRWIAVIAAVAALSNGSRAYAQNYTPGPGAVVVTIAPGGATFFTEGKDTGEPGFNSYGLGGSIEIGLSRYIGIEGEVNGALGVTQDLEFAGVTSNLKSPNLVNYSGNLVVSVPNRGQVVPYVTGGVGALTLFDKPSLGISETDTFLTGNVGGGVKWFASPRWGVRGDYRFLAVRSKDDASAFFGQEARYGHRVYAGVLFNVMR